MRVLIAGDSHGSIRAWEYWIKAGLRFDVDAIFQAGDNHDLHAPANYYDRLDELLGKARILGYVIDGNHDPYDMLSAYKEIEPGLHEIRKTLFFVDRGAVVDFGGLNFMGLGGAYSVDRAAREEKTKEDGIVRYWPSETLTVEQAKAAMDRTVGCKIDVMVTHDFPYGVDFAKQKVLTRDDKADDQRKLIRRVVAVAKPNVLYHGHHHRRYNDRLLIDNHEISIRGLADHLRYQDSYTVFDTEEYREAFEED